LVEKVTSEAGTFDASSIRTILPKSGSRTIRHLLKCLTPIREKRDQWERDLSAMSRTSVSSRSDSDWRVPDGRFSWNEGMEMLVTPLRKVRKRSRTRKKRSASTQSGSGGTRVHGVSPFSKI
jgi:hypothetical protein